MKNPEIPDANEIQQNVVNDIADVALALPAYFTELACGMPSQELLVKMKQSMFAPLTCGAPLLNALCQEMSMEAAMGLMAPERIKYSNLRQEIASLIDVETSRKGSLNGYWDYYDDNILQLRQIAQQGPGVDRV